MLTYGPVTYIPVLRTTTRTVCRISLRSIHIDQLSMYYRSISTHPEFGRQMATRARRFTRDYSWEREFAGYLQLLGRLTGRELTAKAPPEQQSA